MFVIGLFILAWPQQKRLVVVCLVGFAVALAVSADVRERTLPVSSDSTEQSSDGGYESYDWRIENWGGLLDKAGGAAAAGVRAQEHGVREPARDRELRGQRRAVGTARTT